MEEKATYTTFAPGGADAIVYINGQEVHEITEVKYEEDLQNGFVPKPIKGYIEALVFNQYTVKEALRGVLASHVPLQIRFHNDYGKSVDMVFINTSFTKRIGGVAVDNIVMSERYYFEAEDIQMHDAKKADTFVCEGGEDECACDDLEVTGTVQIAGIEQPVMYTTNPINWDEEEAK